MRRNPVAVSTAPLLYDSMSMNSEGNENYLSDARFVYTLILSRLASVGHKGLAEGVFTICVFQCRRGELRLSPVTCLRATSLRF